MEERRGLVTFKLPFIWGQKIEGLGAALQIEDTVLNVPG